MRTETQLQDEIADERKRRAEHKIKRSYNGEGYYRAKCSCGWRSERRATWPEAEADARAHKP